MANSSVANLRLRLMVAFACAALTTLVQNQNNNNCVEALKRYQNYNYGDYNYGDQDSSGWLNIGGYGKNGAGGYLSLGKSGHTGYNSLAGYNSNYYNSYAPAYGYYGGSGYNGYNGFNGFNGYGTGIYNSAYGRPSYINQYQPYWGQSSPYSSYLSGYPYVSASGCATGVLGNTLGGGGLLSGWLA